MNHHFGNFVAGPPLLQISGRQRIGRWTETRRISDPVVTVQLGTARSVRDANLTKCPRMEAAKQYRDFVAGDRIVWAGDEMEFVASVVSGTATLSQTMADGAHADGWTPAAIGFLGRPGRSTAPYDVTAASDLTLCCFQRRPFEEMMRRSPQIGQRLLEMTLDELDAAREWMLVLGRKTAREKIASLLLSLFPSSRGAGANDCSGRFRS